jgi:hypothetical protein
LKEDKSLNVSDADGLDAWLVVSPNRATGMVIDFPLADVKGIRTKGGQPQQKGYGDEGETVCEEGVITIMSVTLERWMMTDSRADQSIKAPA